MSRRKERVHYHLDSGGITNLTSAEIKAILRGADGLIATGGRSILAKILKGSKDKDIIKHGLDQNPVYGFYRNYKLPEIAQRIDWVIENGYIRIEYNGKLPVIVYTETGWEIERDAYTDELKQKLTSLLDNGDYSFVEELKDRDRGMILMLLEKIKNTNNRGFIPLLKAWQEIDYKKVQIIIQEVIDYLDHQKPVI